MSLYGILKIEYCNAANLTFSDRFGAAIETCTPTNAFENVCFVQNTAILKVESAVENKQNIYNTELQFTSESEPELENGNYAFLVTTVENKQFLIGCPSRPRVVVTTARNEGTNSNNGGYTTKCSFRAVYKPKQVPDTSTPFTDTRNLTICCGEVQYTEQQSDTRQFNICCGKINTESPIPGPAYDICCGQIVGTPNVLTIIWQNYDGSEVDRETYIEGEAEPTTSVVPTRPSTELISYTFSNWQLYSQTTSVKIYRAEYTEEYARIVTVAEITRTESGIQVNAYCSIDGKQVTQIAIIDNTDLTRTSNQIEQDVCLYINNPERVTAVEWNEEELPADKTWIYKDGTDVKIGYYIGDNEPTSVHGLAWMTNDGTASMESWYFFSGKEIYPPETPPTREGYRFMGWSEDSDGQPVTDYGVMPSNNKTFWAVWQQI